MDEAINTQKNVIGKPFEKGNPGRPKGSTNHLTKTVKETVLAVFNELQKDKEANLKAFAKKNTRDFYQIAAKLIPTEVTGNFKHVINVLDQEEDGVNDNNP